MSNNKKSSNKHRVLIPLAILLVATIAYVMHFDFGTLSTFGWSSISFICPLGALTTLLAAKTMIPHVLIALVVGLVLMVLFGRLFCGWICPVPVVGKLRDVFGKKKAKVAVAVVEDEATAEGEGAEAAETSSVLDDAAKAEIAAEMQAVMTSACGGVKEGVGACGSCTTCASKRKLTLDSRHVVLGGTILSAAIFGFPVFCLVCPIGLTFATIFLVINLFGTGDLTWTVVLVPVLLAVEVLFFRKWCSKICPLSAFISLMNKTGKFMRPVIDDAKCLETSRGKKCGICGELCPEKIDPRHPDYSERDMSECTKCKVCVENCPAGAIKMPFLEPKAARRVEAPAVEAVQTEE